MGKKDKKSKTAEQKARLAAKQSKKAAHKEKKVRAKGGDDSDGEEVDLESVLEVYAKQVRQSAFKLMEIKSSSVEFILLLNVQVLGKLAFIQHRRDSGCFSPVSSYDIYYMGFNLIYSTPNSAS